MTQIAVQIDVPTLRTLEDASEALYGFARLLDGTEAARHSEQLRRGANAIIETIKEHPAHSSSYEQDSAMGAGEHVSEMRHLLRLHTNHEKPE